jgi:hypothetical protein
MRHAERATVLRALSSFLLSALVLSGCFASPQPDPPSLVPDTIVPRGSDRGGTYTIAGAPGSVVGGDGARVFVAVLDSTAPILGADVEEDGSFAFLSVGLEEGDEVRMWAQTRQARSAPLDLRVQGEEFVAPSRPLGCVRAMPAQALEVEGTASIALVNECGETIAIDSAVLRAPAPFTLGTIPSVLDPSGSIEVTFDGASDADEVLLITFSGAETERRPFTLHGVATD